MLNVKYKFNVCIKLSTSFQVDIKIIVLVIKSVAELAIYEMQNKL